MSRTVRWILWGVTLVVLALGLSLAGTYLFAGGRLVHESVDLYRGLGGWLRWYVLVGSVTGVGTLAALVPKGVARLQRAAHGHDRVSGVVEGALLVPFLVAGGVALATAAGAAWPVTLIHWGHRKLRDRRRQREALAREEQALLEEVRDTRHEPRGRGAP